MFRDLRCYTGLQARYMEPSATLHTIVPLLPFSHVFFYSTEEYFVVSTLKVKDSIFLIVDSCCWSTCMNSFLPLPYFFIPAFTHGTCLQSQQRSKIPSFVLPFASPLSCLLVE
ncbi:hypothetical protein BJY01DRAFT_147193 [Aspergillus pseudoustus]|uniref:Uncharacterized protein n=1 Tax=Aspergillus pseudoustus TaxID=1810923 RepID=A0ABR4KAC7_9EURO